MDRVVNTNKVKNTDNVKNTANVKKPKAVVGSARKCFMYIP